MSEEKESITENIQGTLSNFEQTFENNKKAITIGGGVTAAIVIGLIYVFVQYLPEQNLQAQKAMYMAEFAFAKDSFELALKGNAAHKGFEEIADKYSMTKAGKLAHYYAGICNLQLKKYDDAIKHLDKFSTDDAVIGALRLNALGDAYAEKGNMAEASNYYQKAADYSDNDSYTPYYLFKTGLALEYQKKYAEAQKCYQSVRDRYPNSDEGRDIEKYIARTEAASK